MLVPEGSYSGPEADNETLRYQQIVCPLGYYCSSGVRQPCSAGSYGGSLGLSARACSGLCTPGYYCTAASPSATQHPCGSPAVYCPLGSEEPIVAGPGELTLGLTNATRNASSLCQPTKYCVNGSEYLCPAGRFGCASKLGTPECSGLCAAGYYCPVGSLTNNMFTCGNASVYCPDGAATPTLVDVGNYSLGGPSESQQTRQAVCPHGSYCVNGAKVRWGGSSMRG